MKAHGNNFSTLCELQRQMAQQVVLSSLKGEIRFISGVDCSEVQGRVRAAAVLMSWPQLEELGRSAFEDVCTVPYVPGFLSFREMEPMMKALEALKGPVDLILVDGCGIAHPRGLGIASHLGVATGVPSIGVSKSPLVGSFEEPGEAPLSSSPLVFQGRQVGWALRSRKGCKPIFVSPGHLIDLEGALETVKMALRGYKLPEPIRRADRLSKLRPPKA
ncbi:deoxyinosine 3'endonuclease (endonuclease V) [Thermanaerovibrio velox DSM 12556]|uniref:Endonuclease V n=1 Tax=Thermanaerovibrio velox DSM 12556 TaxID=926567 RepID=H0UPC8_9BACT|nr:endonuclease V [Thermanaerovibrio velox]EHM10559.1 deoxyinosine 3'endonuclease (endonuclease V) [Thermanaerovibrio velox DSM 12556]